MTEIKRTRSRAVAEDTETHVNVEVRRSRPRPAPTDEEELDLTVPAPDSRLTGYGKGEVATIILKVRTTVLEGNMHGGDLENWFRAALHAYHSSRGGKIGYSALATVSSPICARIDKVL